METLTDHVYESNKWVNKDVRNPYNIPAKYAYQIAKRHECIDAGSRCRGIGFLWLILFKMSDEISRNITSVRTLSPCFMSAFLPIRIVSHRTETYVTWTNNINSWPTYHCDIYWLYHFFVIHAAIRCWTFFMSVWYHKQPLCEMRMV